MASVHKSIQNTLKNNGLLKLFLIISAFLITLHYLNPSKLEKPHNKYDPNKMYV